ncbi:hypothetical protein MKW98_001240 [Papaver atlanticum]|uniref:Uncharacterized protein n=1 Tax=Papaver atlanticum TaxID=357466 RepID=A0AAD4SRW1_9MAGN|nr:hypothetical protein MKW98_001240 [Papaver atlanticum]
MKATFDHNNFKIYMGCTNKSYWIFFVILDDEDGQICVGCALFLFGKSLNQGSCYIYVQSVVKSCGYAGILASHALMCLHSDASNKFPDSLQSVQKAFRAAGTTYKTLDQLPKLVKGSHGRLKYGYLENGMKWISWETTISPALIFCFSMKM